MEKERLISDYLNWQEMLGSYSLALQVMSFDRQTIAPNAGKAYSGKMMSILSGEQYKIATDPKAKEIIAKLLEISDLDCDLKTELKLLVKENEDMSCIPIEEYVAYNKLQADANVIWEQAKNTDDYELFKPYLLDIMNTTKKVVEYRQKDDVFEELINDYERGMNSTRYEEFFNLIEEKLVPLIKKINEIKLPVDYTILNKSVPLDVQKQITEFIAEYLGFDSSWGYLTESVHPFSSAFSTNDIRLTTRYDENNFVSNIYSVIHELGHGLFGHQIDSKYDGRHISNAITCGLHESQSRMLENYIAKSKGFWKANYTKLQEKIDYLKDVTLDDFYMMINRVECSLIRVEADELTYPIHILIRYRIEKGMMSGEVNMDNLPAVWNKYMEDYLGVTVPNNAEGILQDVHWSYGYIGYFPTYALGSAYAAQFYDKMIQDLNVEDLLANNQFSVISEWLRVNIHQYGGLYTADELLVKLTGNHFDANYYIDYLTNKFSDIYKLK